MRVVGSGARLISDTQVEVKAALMMDCFGIIKSSSYATYIAKVKSQKYDTYAATVGATYSVLTSMAVAVLASMQS